MSVGACGADRIGEVRRHDADDLVAAFGRGPTSLQILERDRAADDLGIPAEAAPPQAVAQDRHAVAAGDFVLRGEAPPDRRRDAQHVEEPRGDALRHQRLGLGARLRAA